MAFKPANVILLFKSLTDPAMVDDPAKDPQFAEPAVDNIRAQKDEVHVHNYIHLVVLWHAAIIIIPVYGIEIHIEYYF